MSGGAELNAKAEIEKLINRLIERPTVYVARPEGRLAALALKLKGYVTTAEGEGMDLGLLVVRRTPKFPNGQVVAPGAPDGGGEAA